MKCSEAIQKKIQTTFSLSEKQSLKACYQAELTGKAPKEAIYYIESKEGTGVRNIEIAVFTLLTKQPELLIRRQTHSESFSPGYLQIQDLDRDGKDEILVIGDTEGVSNRNLMIFEWANGQLNDRVYGEDCGISYFFLDTNGDKKSEVVALTGKDIFYLKKDISGFYIKSEYQITYVELFKKILINSQFRRPSYDAPFFEKEFKK
ncbi:MAG: hypothetical protein KDK45_02885, partial [Leptospiraceae bacterium]|nr:hypothetical protein [Leptospiraceae bacterium]